MTEAEVQIERIAKWIRENAPEEVTPDAEIVDTALRLLEEWKPSSVNWDEVR